jgi:hypothetical protein
MNIAIAVPHWQTTDITNSVEDIEHPNFVNLKSPNLKNDSHYTIVTDRDSLDLIGTV